MHPAPPSTDYLERQQKRIDAVREGLARIGVPSGRITLEIGSGHGHFLTGYAAAHPSKICVGIDMMLDRHMRAERKRTRTKLANLHFVGAAAEDFLPALPTNLLLEDVFVLFPDPWPKRRHHKNRLIQSAFLDKLHRRCLPDARLCFRTDHEQYFAAAYHTVTEHTGWRLELQEPWPFELLTVFQSRAPSYQSFIARRVPLATSPE